MSAGRAFLPVAAAALALCGAAGSALFLHQRARGVAERLLHERLVGAGESAAALLSAESTPEQLRRLRDAHALEAASLVDASLALRADAEGHRSGKLSLLRLDPGCVESALKGAAKVSAAYTLEGARLASGCFPLAAAPDQVLVLEAGEAFFADAALLDRARDLALALAAAGALALALLAWRWTRLEASRATALAGAARAEALREVAAAAAHEIRNPLGTVRATVELLLERQSGDGPAVEKTRAALRDVLGEVERLRQLTDDLLDLSSERPLASQAFDLAELAAEAARTFGAAHPDLKLTSALGTPLPVRGDPGRLRQVLLNLFDNAQKTEGVHALVVRGERTGGQARLVVADDGPGIDAAVRARLFSPFATGRSGGTGLGLAVSQRLMQRQGGALGLLDSGAGASFEVRLPLEPS